MKRAPKIGQKIPTVTLGGEDALRAENCVALAALKIQQVANQLRNALPILIRNFAPMLATASIAESLIDAETAASDARWAADYLRDEINPHRAAIKAVLEAETTEAFDAVAKPAKPVRVRGKRGRK